MDSTYNIASSLAFLIIPAIVAGWLALRIVNIQEKNPMAYIVGGFGAFLGIVVVAIYYQSSSAPEFFYAWQTLRRSLGEILYDRVGLSPRTINLSMFSLGIIFSCFTLPVSLILSLLALKIYQWRTRNTEE